MEHEHRRPSLRERNKIRTREAIRRAAIELVERNGYANTSVEHIAEAAEVSPSTFFRYFRNKESVLICELLDQVAIATLAKQPPDVPTAEAFTRAMVAARSALSDDGSSLERRCRELVFAIPELRRIQHDFHRRTGETMAEVECKRLGRDADDFEVRIFFGALFDAGLAVLDASPDVPPELHRVIEFVDDGMPLR